MWELITLSPMQAVPLVPTEEQKCCVTFKLTLLFLFSEENFGFFISHVHRRVGLRITVLCRGYGSPHNKHNNA